MSPPEGGRHKKYGEIIKFSWTYNFKYFLGRAIHEVLKDPDEIVIHFSSIAYNL